MVVAFAGTHNKSVWLYCGWLVEMKHDSIASFASGAFPAAVAVDALESVQCRSIHSFICWTRRERMNGSPGEISNFRQWIYNTLSAINLLYDDTTTIIPFYLIVPGAPYDIPHTFSFLSLLCPMDELLYPVLFLSWLFTVIVETTGKFSPVPMG